MKKALVLLFSAILPVILSVATAFAAPEVPFLLPPKQEINKLKSAILYTDKGEVYFELFPEDAPWHVANFKYLADKGFYKNRPFHLYYADYAIQAGALRKNEFSVFGYALPPEFSEREHEPGTLGMARVRDEKNPQRKSTGTQFHILLDYSRKMNGSYTIFGQVTGGMDVVKRLRRGDFIRDLKVFVRE